ncbi:MAG: hypothetical protein QOH63_1962 [Acidobacteriota bacterium]|nr:hypothetical protein [Acidobacteriota bacterium]
MWLLIFLQVELQQTPVVLGQTGTIILGVILLVLAALNTYQFYKAKNVERLDQALHTTETEMNVYRQRAERQSKELAEANQRIGELTSKTDLSAVLTMLSDTISLTRESVELSRKFDRENSQTNLSIANLIQKHGESDKEIFRSIDESLKETTATLKELKDEITGHRAEAATMVKNVVGQLKGIEGRLNRRPHERT